MIAGEVYMISFSGGRTSAYMTERLLRELPPDQVIVCFANTGKEEPETLEFVRRCDEHWKNTTREIVTCVFSKAETRSNGY